MRQLAVDNAFMLELNGQSLTIQQIADVAARREHVTLSPEARERVERARQVVEQIVTEGRTVYGVNTGFGKLSDVSIERSDLRQLQLNLVRSHSCGLGEPLSDEEARAFWPRILQRAPGYTRYLKATDRVIPLVRLVPIELGEKGQATSRASEEAQRQEV